jgi:hypothetical protein
LCPVTVSVEVPSERVTVFEVAPLPFNEYVEEGSSGLKKARSGPLPVTLVVTVPSLLVEVFVTWRALSPTVTLTALFLQTCPHGNELVESACADAVPSTAPTPSPNTGTPNPISRRYIFM